MEIKGFVSGVAFAGYNGVMIADKVGLFDSPALIVFTTVIMFAICLLGGVCGIAVYKWANKKFEVFVDKYFKWLVKN